MKTYCQNFLNFCKNATNAQLENILRNECEASKNNKGRKCDYEAAKIEAANRGWTVVNGQRQ